MLGLAQLVGAQVCTMELHVTPYIFDRAVLAGSRVQFDTGSDPIPNGQWYFRGSPLGGATGSSLVIESAKPSDAGG